MSLDDLCQSEGPRGETICMLPLGHEGPCGWERLPSVPVPPSGDDYLAEMLQLNGPRNRHQIAAAFCRQWARMMRQGQEWDTPNTMAACLEQIARALDEPIAPPVTAAPPTPEVCICAAIQFPDGGVVYGHRHDGAITYAGGMGLSPRDAVQGFVTTRHRFVKREEAARLQRAAGIPSADAERGMFPTVLFSEDLYRGAATLPVQAEPVTAAPPTPATLESVLGRLLDEFDARYGNDQGDIGLPEVRAWLESRHVHWPHEKPVAPPADEDDLGACEGCERPFQGDDFRGITGDDVYLCRECYYAVPVIPPRAEPVTAAETPPQEPPVPFTRTPESPLTPGQRLEDLKRTGGYMPVPLTPARSEEPPMSFGSIAIKRAEFVPSAELQRLDEEHREAARDAVLAYLRQRVEQLEAALSGPLDERDYEALKVLKAELAAVEAARW